MKMIKIAAMFIAAACIVACKSHTSSSQPETLFEGTSDIGNVLHEGSLSYDRANDCYTISAAGLNCWNEKDDFFFVWKKVSGDFEISGDVAFEGEGVNPHRKLGFMIRETLDADSKYADIAVHGEGLTSLQYRPDKAAMTLESVSEAWGPTKVSLIRRGNTIAVRTGMGTLPETDDTSIELEFPAECYVGIFMCSHEDDVVETGYISNIVLK